jgi:hypothetical protein
MELHSKFAIWRSLKAWQERKWGLYFCERIGEEIRLLLFCFWENGGAIFLGINFWEFWMQVWKELSMGWYGRWIDDEQFNVFSHPWTDDNYNSLSNKKWWILIATLFFFYSWSFWFFLKPWYNGSWRTPKLLDCFNYESKGENGKRKSWGIS